MSKHGHKKNMVELISNLAYSGVAVLYLVLSTLHWFHHEHKEHEEPHGHFPDTMTWTTGNQDKGEFVVLPTISAIAEEVTNVAE